MDKIQQQLINDTKLDMLYNNNLYTIKSICKEMNIWDDYSNEQKRMMENLTIKDSYINRCYDYNGIYDQTFTYVETLRHGVDDVYKEIKKYKYINNDDIFIDLGSGCGKMVMNMSIISPFRTLVGIEKTKERYMYGNHIKEKILPNDDRIFFFNKDIKDFNISLGTVLYLNNTYFSKDVNDYIIDNITQTCHIITSKKLNINGFRESFKVHLSIGVVDMLYYIYNPKM